jgi:cyclic beta-1,2-glucan synthetase
LAIVFIIGLPAAISLSWNMIWKPKDVLFTQHVIYSIRSARDHFAQHAIDFVFLPYEALRYTDAILRTTWRMWVSHKKLLEWNPSGSPQKGSSIVGALRAMWFVPVISIGLFLYFSTYDPVVLFSALPVLILWFVSPFISWWISTPTAIGNGHLSEEHKIFLHKLSRKTWAFFEKFMGDEDNWLPPDNYQEEPVERIAHRTSPTNMGLRCYPIFLPMISGISPHRNYWSAQPIPSAPCSGWKDSAGIFITGMIPSRFSLCIQIYFNSRQWQSCGPPANLKTGIGCIAA